MGYQPDLSAITTSFVEFGGQVIKEGVLQWAKASDGLLIRPNVTAPEALVKANATGQPMPYREQDDFTVSSVDNGVAFTNRILNVFQSKWDWVFSLEKFRNTYLHKYLKEGMTEAQAINQYMADKYMEYIIKNIGNGVRNGSGTTAAAIFDGFLTTIAAEITGSTLTAVATGATTTTNAVAAFEKLIENCDSWMYEKGGVLYCSYKEFFKFKADYRTRYTYLFDPSKKEFVMDSYNFTIKPRSWMGNSSRLIATVEDNLVVGTDVNQIKVYPTPHLDLIYNRITMPAGAQIADLGAIKVGDQA